MCIVWLFKCKSSKILVYDQLGPFPQITQIVCQISAILTEKIEKTESGGGSDRHVCREMCNVVTMRFREN